MARNGDERRVIGGGQNARHSLIPGGMSIGSIPCLPRERFNETEERFAASDAAEISRSPGDTPAADLRAQDMLACVGSILVRVCCLVLRKLWWTLPCLFDAG
jgi:hypothetical protein